MGLKLALNVLYNIGIFFCALTVYWGYQHSQYAYIVGPLFIAGILIILKVKLIKEIRNTNKKP